MVAGLTQRLSDRQTFANTINADSQNIATAIQGDNSLSAKAAADVTHWTTARTTFMSKITADVAKLLADRQQLVTDLTVLQSS